MLVLVFESFEGQVLLAGLLLEPSVVEEGLVEHRVVPEDGAIQLEEL